MGMGWIWEPMFDQYDKDSLWTDDCDVLVWVKYNANVWKQIVKAR